MGNPSDEADSSKQHEAGLASLQNGRLENGRFKPGFSGNLKGRSRKRERSFLPRQSTQDVLEVTEEAIAVNTKSGRKTFSTFQLALREIRNKALKGHGPSQRFIVKLHLEALEDHYRRHEEFSLLEISETGLVYETEPVSAAMMDWINKMRKGSRKT